MQGLLKFAFEWNLVRVNKVRVPNETVQKYSLRGRLVRDESGRKIVPTPARGFRSYGTSVGAELPRVRSFRGTPLPEVLVPIL